MFTEVFQLITDDLSIPLKKLTDDRANSHSLVEHLKASANEYWNIAVEYEYARKHEWISVKQLKRTELMSFDDEKLANHQHYYAIIAYEYYRAALREFKAIACKEKLVEEAELNKCIALSLSMAGASRQFEVQIYAIIGIYLLVANDKDCFCRESFETLQKLLQKICWTKTSPSTASVNTGQIEKDKSTLNKAVMAYSQGSITLQQFQSALSSELRFTIFNKYSPSGMTEIEEIMRPSSVSSSVGIGVLYLIGDILLGHEFYHKKQPDLEKSQIREVLNKIMNNALDYYSKGQYSNFLHSLTTSYSVRKILIGIKQIQHGNKYKISLDIRPAIIVSELLGYKFSPEGIANFLILLGEVLLSVPELKPKQKLPADICLELPNYFDFIHCATLLFDEVSKNTQLTEEVNNFEGKVKLDLLLKKKNHIEYLEKTSSNHTYSMSNSYIKEKSKISAIARLKELRIVAKVNYVIAKLIAGGAENLQHSVNMIKSVKQELEENLTEDKMFVVAEIRLQALTDILSTFGFIDHISSASIEVIFPHEKSVQLASDVDIKNIDKFVTDDGKFSHCEPVVLLDDDEIDDFLLLDEVVGRSLILNKTKFIKNVCGSYYNNVEPLKSWITEIISKENLLSIKEWKSSFLERKYSLTFQYLPFLSVMYNLIFQPCTVQSHPQHKLVFAPTKEMIDFSKGSAKISIYVLTEKKNDSGYAREIKGFFVACDVSLSYIYNQLESTSDRKLKVDLLNQIAFYHRCQAEKLDKTHHLDSLQQWSRAQKFYNESLTLNSSHLLAMLGYATCLIKLNKYTLAEKFLVENAERKAYFCDSPERWFLVGVLKRKLQKYDEAKDAIEKACCLKKDYVEAKHELDLILKLKKDTVTERIKLYKKMSLAHAEPNTQQYNILSIDGGGIRGLIPAMWISELERRTGMSSSSMFHMMAGTSTGAIVTACLSLPDTPGIRQPRYKAVDIVQLYRSHSEKVFTRATRMQSLFGLKHAYLEEEKKTLFSDYLGDARLSQTLNDLIITAVNSGNTTTELFRRSDSLADPSRDHKLSDILMCTTAAPTYFPPYKMNDSVFVDGGVQANNPAMIAYSEACAKKINRDNIFLLSLGTGDYVPDPLRPSAERSLLFWAYNNSNVLKVIFDGPQNNIDCQLSNMLDNDKYHRWQIWLEKPIVLDDIRKETLDHLTELAHAHFEEMDAFDDNNRLGKLIERLKNH
ncbi:unnamed protein product [Rotaria sp. Silwood2]|nr:unnamed protein product [Rotaria sp. Silwood2]